MLKNPLISILLPNYNYGHYIENCLNALQNQTYSNFEVILVEDASTDDSLKRIQPFVEKDSRFKLILNKTNLGCHRSAMKALSACSGEYICTTASDDLLLPNFLDKKARAIENNPDIGLFCSVFTYFDDHKPDIWLTNPQNPPQSDLKLNREELIQYIKNHRFFIPGNTTVFKKKYALEFGGFEEKYGSHTDWITLHRIGFKYGCYFIPETLSLMRLHQKSLSASESLEKKKNSWIEILAELSLKKNAELKKAFIQSHIFNTFGLDFYEFIIKNPKYWPFFKLHVYKHFYKRWKSYKKNLTLTKVGN
jgi:glycosyltransferase involved in cell wall biosynthesis